MFLFVVSVKPFKDSESSSEIKLPHKYKKIADVFDNVKASILPEHRPSTRERDTMGTDLYFVTNRAEVLGEYIDENLANGFIRHSKSLVGAPIFFVKKKDGSLLLVLDYRGLNKVTIRNRYALPLISSLLERPSGTICFY